MVINTNQAALNASTALMSSSARLSQSLARLSSGSRIASPADDSAGLAVSMRFNAQLARINAASSNVSNAISLCQTQDGYLQQVSAALNRMSELSVAAQDVTKSSSDILLCGKEYQDLGNYLLHLADKTFNGVSLFDGHTLNVTSDSDGNTFAMNGVNLFNTTILVNAAFQGLELIKGPEHAATLVSLCISQLASDRAAIGANEQTLGYLKNQFSSLSNNLPAANSQITDVDVAQESTNYAKENILVQAGTAMLAQANVLPQSVLKLLG